MPPIDSLGGMGYAEDGGSKPTTKNWEELGMGQPLTMLTVAEVKASKADALTAYLLGRVVKAIVAVQDGHKAGLVNGVFAYSENARNAVTLAVLGAAMAAANTETAKAPFQVSVTTTATTTEIPASVLADFAPVDIEALAKAGAISISWARAQEVIKAGSLSPYAAQTLEAAAEEKEIRRVLLRAR